MQEYLSDFICSVTLNNSLKFQKWKPGWGNRSVDVFAFCVDVTTWFQIPRTCIKAWHDSNPLKFQLFKEKMGAGNKGMCRSRQASKPAIYLGAKTKRSCLKQSGRSCLTPKIGLLSLYVCYVTQTSTRTPQNMYICAHKSRTQTHTYNSKE